MEKLWNKFVNRETILYVIFGVLTTLTDWLSYAWLREMGIEYRMSTVGSWVAAVAFAFVTNKLFVFESRSMDWNTLRREVPSFVGCRAATGLFTLVVMILMVDGLGITQDMICKIVVSGISLVLNYVLSKLFIFKK